MYGDLLEVITGRLYEVWEVYWDLIGVIGVIYMRFGKGMGTLWRYRGSFI